MESCELKILDLESKNVPKLSEKNSSIPSLSTAVKIACDSKVIFGEKAYFEGNET